ncbi:MAG: PD40 domain-containing protein [Bacteroidia bacterium]|nr:PD40 domain-containing protein [Bacteroidia bacterium]
MKNKLLVYLLVFCSVAFSQVTNTKKWRKTEQDSMQKALIMYDEKDYKAALPIYENLFKSHPKEDFLKFVYGRCCLSRSDKHEDALTYLTEIYTKNKKAESIEYDMARAYHYNYKFDEALTMVDQCLANKRTFPDEKIAAQQLRKYIINAKDLYSKPTNATITNAGSVLNTEYEEYVPVVSADESVMIFTYVGKESTGGRMDKMQQPFAYGDFYEDVFQSVKVNDQWTKPRGISTINTKVHDAAIAISPDGQQLFVYRDNGDDHGDIYVSFLHDTTWTVPQKLKGQVNSYSWEGSCSLTSDGKTLYFSSERAGGYGGRDIYRASLSADSTWGNVINLGDSINTNLDDDAPFIHPDGITLFYSSKNKNSMGGYDIFQAIMNPVDSTFKNAVNVGYPINTPDDDIYYVLSANGKTGYYASGKKGGSGLKDIYLVDPGYIGKKPLTYLVKGKITLNNQPVEAKIDVVVTSKNNKKFTEAKSNSATGNYLVTLPAGSIFKLTYTYKDFPARTLDIDASAITDFTEKEFNIEFNTTPDTAKPLVKDTVKPIAVVTPTVAPKKDDFVAKTPMQAKVQKYAAMYGDIVSSGLEFRVQVAAYKYPKNYKYPHLKPYGKVDQLLLEDGITRITIGGAFLKLGEAFEHNKKVIKAGQTDAFVTAIYNGRRVYLEELEALGIFKKSE